MQKNRENLLFTLWSYTFGHDCIILMTASFTYYFFKIYFIVVAFQFFEGVLGLRVYFKTNPNTILQTKLIQIEFIN